VPSADNPNFGEDFVYDALDRVTQLTHKADGTHAHYPYIGFDLERAEDENGHYTRFEWDELHRMADMFAPGAAVEDLHVSCLYNNLDQPREIHWPHGHGDPASMAYEYYKGGWPM